MAGDIGARAVSDGDVLARSCSVCLGSVWEGGSNWAVGGIDVGGDGRGDICAVPATC